MGLKDLLVHVGQTEPSLARLRLAADLAIRNDNRLTALYVGELSRSQLDWRKVAELGSVSADGMHKLEAHIEASINAVAVRFEAMLDELADQRSPISSAAITRSQPQNSRNSPFFRKKKVPCIGRLTQWCKTVAYGP
jgi:hypothetical protein